MNEEIYVRQTCQQDLSSKQIILSKAKEIEQVFINTSLQTEVQNYINTIVNCGLRSAAV